MQAPTAFWDDTVLTTAYVINMINQSSMFPECLVAIVSATLHVQTDLIIGAQSQVCFLKSPPTLKKKKKITNVIIS